jgi:hypothetical protein
MRHARRMKLYTMPEATASAIVDKVHLVMSRMDPDWQTKLMSDPEYADSGEYEDLELRGFRRCIELNKIWMSRTARFALANHLPKLGMHFAARALRRGEFDNLVAYPARPEAAEPAGV